MDLANAALLESWQLSLHDRRPRTVEVYLRDVEQFALWLSRDLTTAVKADVLTWIREQQQRGLKPNTIRSRWIALRVFYGWALEEGEIELNPLLGVTVARGHDPAPDVLAKDDTVLLLKACEGTSFMDRRDLALIRLMLATGARCAESVSFGLADIDLPNRIGYIRDGKGGKARVVRFDPATAAALDRYKRIRARHKAASSPALWLGERGALTTAGVPQILRKRAAIAGIGHVFPHQLRHTWADRWLDGGGLEGDLMRLGGWESPAIMRRYGEARAVDRALGSYDEVDPMRGL